VKTFEIHKKDEGLQFQHSPTGVAVKFIGDGVFGISGTVQMDLEDVDNLIQFLQDRGIDVNKTAVEEKTK
jgi:hypothetical protein